MEAALTRKTTRRRKTKRIRRIRPDMVIKALIEKALAKVKAIIRRSMEGKVKVEAIGRGVRGVAAT